MLKGHWKQQASFNSGDRTHKVCLEGKLTSIVMLWFAVTNLKLGAGREIRTLVSWLATTNNYQAILCTHKTFWWVWEELNFCLYHVKVSFYHWTTDPWILVESAGFEPRTSPFTEGSILGCGNNPTYRIDFLHSYATITLRLQNWHRRRESNPPHPHRQWGITIRWSLRYKTWSPWVDSNHQPLSSKPSRLPDWHYTEIKTFGGPMG